MLKIEDLKVGDRLECIDIDLYLDLDDEWKKPRLKIIESSLIIDRIYDGSGLSIKDCELCVPASDFKYFKKKEQYTFDDLIDVAVQAYKDRVINGFTVVGGVLKCQTLDGEDYNLGIGCEVAHGIEYLQSLYKETFVVEREEDLARIKVGASIVFLNDNNGVVSSIGILKDCLTIIESAYALDFFSLKGAKVEQAKG